MDLGGIRRLYLPLRPKVRFSPGTEHSGGSFRGTGHGPFRALIVSSLKWGGPCRGHYVFPQADTKSSAFYKGAMKAYRISRTR